MATQLIPTVTGAVADAGGSSGCAWVLPGEFFFADFTNAALDATPCGPFCVAELAALRENPRARAENMRFTAADEATAAADVREVVKAAGGGTVVACDLATRDTGRDLEALARVANATGIVLVASTGYHLSPLMAGDRPGLDDYSFIERELTGSIEAPPVCGAISCSPHRTWTSDTEKLMSVCALEASGKSCPLNIVLPPDFQALDDLLSVLQRSFSDAQPGPPLVTLFNATTDLRGGCERWVSVLSKHPFLRLSVEYFAWDGLSSFGRHPFGFELPRVSEVVQLIEQLSGLGADRVVHSTLHCMKVCNTAWGGPGRASLLRYLDRTPKVCPVGARAELRPYAWWAPPAPKPQAKVYWKCDHCGEAQEEVLPDRSFRKNTFRYCSIACLRGHTPVEPDKEKERRAGPRSGGGGGAGSWGISMTR
ncbi:hypothetical protein DIPPA_22857 [Diplonema papillatum]|nr:hypothetical protein DIPPA_22857 [Diplonema papillatum]